MNVTINELSEILQEAEITLSDQELQPHFDAALGKEQKRLEIKGFRKGKAPLAMVRKLYGEVIEHQTLDSVANDFYHKAMDERSIRPLGDPSLVDMDYRRGESLRFKIQYEIRPSIKVKGYRKLQVEKPVHPVTDEEVEKELTRIRKANSTTEDTASVTDLEHVVTADLQELDESGTPIIGRKAKDLHFYLNDEEIAPEIRDALRNAETGGSYRTRIEPKEEGKEPMNVLFSVTKIQKVLLPEADDPFVSKLTNGKVTTAADFRTNLRTDIERHWADWSDRQVAGSISDQIVQKHDFPVPESLVNTVIDSYLEDLKGRTKERKLPPDFDEEQFRKESRENAVWQAKWLLLKEAIAEEEEIRVTDEDLEQAAEVDAGRYGLPKEQVLGFYQKSSSASNQILTKKIMDFLVSHSTISEKEVTP